MICSPCQPTKKIPDCFDKLIIGLVEQALTDYYVYIKDLTTGGTIRVEATSNSGKELKIDNSSSFSPAHSYEVWVTLKSAATFEDRQQILIDSKTETKDCFSVRFDTSFTGGEKNNQDTVTLKAA